MFASQREAAANCETVVSAIRDSGYFRGENDTLSLTLLRILYQSYALRQFFIALINIWAGEESTSPCYFQGFERIFSATFSPSMAALTMPPA